MDKLYSNTEVPIRKPGQHLTAFDRGQIAALHNEGYSNRAIAKILNCSPSTIGYELKRGTAAYGGRGRKPKYSPKRGQSVYKANRAQCHRRRRDYSGSEFLVWMVKQLRLMKWSLDQCRGHALLHQLFPNEQLPCTKTLYNMLWQRRLLVTVFDCPSVLGRKRNRIARAAKRMNGISIELRPGEVDQRNSFGHWEIDTVVGKKRKDEACAFTLVERLTGYYLCIKVKGKQSGCIEDALLQLKEEFGDQFSRVFRSVTTDNGTEFATLSKMELGGTKVYYAHPYSSWERPINERSNGFLRRFIPKGHSMNALSEDEVLQFADMINTMPRKRLGYQTPDELFDQYLDEIYRTGVV